MKFPKFSLRDLYGSVKEPIIDFKKSRRHERQSKITAILIPENGLGETFSAVTNETNGFLVIPELGRMALDVHPFYLNGEKLVLCPEDYQNTVNIPQLSGFANALNYECDIVWDLTAKEKKYLIELIGNSEIGYNVLEKLKEPINSLRFHVTNIHGTINFKAFNNNFGSDFSHQSYSVTSSKILTFLEDSVTRKIFILTIIIAIGIGIGIGAFFGSTITTFIISIIFMILKR